MPMPGRTGTSNRDRGDSEGVPACLLAALERPLPGPQWFPSQRVSTRPLGAFS